MKFSLEWIREHVAVNASDEQIAERLTAGGHAVEGKEVQDGDSLLDLEIVTNRPDCMNVRGIAREVAAFFRTELNPLEPLLRVPESGPPVAELASVKIHAPAVCRRFVARVVRGVSIGPSPEWIASRLLKAGLRPISNLVDITNFVMLELGHPLHAFDLATLEKREIHVRLAKPGERLVTLDGVERRLEDWMVVVADAGRAVSLAGVMGGGETEISGTTTDVLLEAAWWDPGTIYRTSRKLGLASDASYRFERGADLAACGQALDRCAALVAEIAGGDVATGSLDEFPGHAELPVVDLRPARVSLLLGAPTEPPEACGALQRLGFEVESAAIPWKVTVPSHRADVSREVDLIEEIGRILGYDRIPEALPMVPSVERGLPPGRDTEHAAREVLEGAGFLEAINPGFTARTEDALFTPWPEQVGMLANPMSERGDAMRSTLLAGLVRNAAGNFRHGAERLRLYELGRVFRAVRAGELPEEHVNLALVAAGPAAPPYWGSPSSAEASLFDVKGALECVLDRARLPVPGIREGGPRYLDPAVAITWELDGKEVGWLGALDRRTAEAMDLERPLVVAEVRFGALLGGPGRELRFRPIPRYPVVTRDLSLVLPHSRRYAEVESTIRAAGGTLVTRVYPFDRYDGSGLPADAVGLSVSICFQHPERTLVSDEVDQAQEKIVEALARDLGARLRE